MSELILDAQNGKIVFSNEKWCRVRVMTNGQKINYGCEERSCLYRKFLAALSGDLGADRLTEIIFGEEYKYFCGLSERYTSLMIAYSGQSEKIIFIPDGTVFSAKFDSNGNKYSEFNRAESTAEPTVLILSEEDRDTGVEILTENLSEKL